MLDSEGPAHTQFTAVVYLLPPRPLPPEALDALYRETSIPYAIQVVDKRRGLFAAPGRHELVIAPDRATYTERFDGQLVPGVSPDVVKDGLLQFLSIVRRTISPDVMAVPQFTWIAHWRCRPQANAVDYLRDTFKIGTVLDLDRIGARIATCVRFVTLDTQEPLDVRLEPLFGDVSRLFVQVTATFPTVHIEGNDATAIEHSFQKSHDALDAVVQMLQERIDDSKGDA